MAGSPEEPAERRPVTDRPDLYTRVMEHLWRHYALMSSPERLAAAVVGVLGSERPPAHRRVGPDAAGIRIAGDLVPDRVWDPLVHRLARSP